MAAENAPTGLTVFTWSRASLLSHVVQNLAWTEGSPIKHRHPLISSLTPTSSFHPYQHQQRQDLLLYELINPSYSFSTIYQRQIFTSYGRTPSVNNENYALTSSGFISYSTPRPTASSTSTTQVAANQLKPPYIV